MLTHAVQSQCWHQLKAAPPAISACCIHKPHFDSLGHGAPGDTVVDMGTCSGQCPCKNNGYDEPCGRPVPKQSLVYTSGNASGVFGPCAGSRPPPPPRPPYEQAHRPIFHMTPTAGHNIDPNGKLTSPQPFQQQTSEPLRVQFV